MLNDISLLQLKGFSRKKNKQHNTYPKQNKLNKQTKTNNPPKKPTNNKTPRQTNKNPKQSKQTNKKPTYKLYWKTSFQNLKQIHKEHNLHLDTKHLFYCLEGTVCFKFFVILHFHSVVS